MANKNLKGIVIEIGGDTTKLGKALESSEQKSASLQRELKQINSALKFNPDSVELLSQKQEVLTDKVKSTTEQLNVLKNAESQIEKQFKSGEIGAEQYRAFQREVLTTESKLQTFSRQLNECESDIKKLGSGTGSATSDLDKLTSAIKDQESKLGKLSDEYTSVVLSQGKGSTEAKQLASQISKLNGELNENKSKLKSAQDATDELTSSLDKVDDSAKNAEGGFTVMKGAIATFAGNILTGAVGMIGDFIGSIGELTEATEEYRQSQAKVAGSAEAFGYSVGFAKDQFNEFYRYVGDDQMATNAITNLMGLGIATDDVKGLAQGAIATWTAYGDSIPIESLTESITESINVGQVTGNLADAINWASRSNEQWNAILGVSAEAQSAFNKSVAEGNSVEDSFTAALSATSDEGVRAQLVTNLLNETYGKSKSTYDELNGSMLDYESAQLKLKDAQSQLATSMQPIQASMLSMKATLVEQLVPAFQAFGSLLSGQISFDEFVNKIGTMIQSAINTVGQAVPQMLNQGIALLTNLSEGAVQGYPNMMSKMLDLVQNIGTWLADSMPTFIQKGFEILSNLVQGITNALPVLISKVPQIIITFANIINDNFPTILAKGVALLWQFLTGILSAIPTLVANIPKIIEAIVAVLMAFQWLNLGSSIIKFLGNGISSMVGFVTSNAGNVLRAITNTLTSLPNTLWNLASTAVSRLASAIGGGVGSAGSAIGRVVSSIVSGISSLPSRMVSIGSDIVRGLWNGIGNMASWIKSKIQGFGKGVLNSLKSFFGIHSPSRLFRDEIGRYLAEGIGVGITDNADAPITALKDLGDDMTSEAQDMNGLTLERKIQASYDVSASADKSRSIDDLFDLLDKALPKLTEATNRNIVLDSGTLVGETISQIDDRLALEYKLKARGV